MGVISCSTNQRQTPLCIQMDRASPGFIFLITLLTGLQERVTVDCQAPLDGLARVYMRD